jgi:hypothetical protein
VPSLFYLLINPATADSAVEIVCAPSVATVVIAATERREGAMGKGPPAGGKQARALSGSEHGNRQGTNMRSDYKVQLQGAIGRCN